MTLLLATRNAHKIAEIRSILGPGFVCFSFRDLPPAPEVLEDANSFAGNATKKAVAIAKWFEAIRGSIHSATIPIDFVLADDSGLEVDALNGAPGVHSARFAALENGEPGNSSDAENLIKLLRLLENVPKEKRTARFRCVLALAPLQTLEAQSASPVCYAEEEEFSTELFEGVCEGNIDLTPRGQGGFGYDPVFIPAGFKETFSELGEETKNKLSHRGKALQAFTARYPNG